MPTKAEILEELEEYRDREVFRCIHGHSGLSHYNCYKKEKGLVDRIGFFDIETFELNADWGFVFSYCIKRQGGSIIRRVLTGKEVLNYKVRDRRLIKQFCQDVKEFDTLVVYYGKDTGGRYQRHDIPFMRTRAMRWKIKNFPTNREKIIIDLYDCVKAKTKQKSNSMEHICKLLGIPAKQTPHDWEVWQRARDGNEKALKTVLMHNDEDVISMEMLFDEVYRYKKVRTLI